MELSEFNNKIVELRKLDLEYGGCFDTGDFLIRVSETNPKLVYENEQIYRNFIFDPCSYLRSSALRSLVINLELQRPEYLKIVVQLISNNKENYEVRLTAFSCIMAIYFKKKDTYILSILCGIMNCKDENFNIRLLAFDSILRVYGYGTGQLASKSYTIILVKKEKYLNFDEFFKEKMKDFRDDFLAIGKLTGKKC